MTTTDPSATPDPGDPPPAPPKTLLDLATELQSSHDFYAVTRADAVAKKAAADLAQSNADAAHADVAQKIASLVAAAQAEAD